MGPISKFCNTNVKWGPSDSATQKLNAVHQQILQHKFRKERRSKALNLLFILQLRTLCTAERMADCEGHNYCTEYQTSVLNKVLVVLSYCIDISVPFMSYVQASRHSSIINLYVLNSPQFTIYIHVG